MAPELKILTLYKGLCLLLPPSSPITLSLETSLESEWSSDPQIFQASPSHHGF